MRKAFSVILFFFLLFIFCQGNAQTEIYKSITVDRRQREYNIHLPPSYSGAKKLPILFAFHGGGGNFNNTVKFYNLNALADKYGFIVIYPNAIAKSWVIPGFSSRSQGYDTTVDDAHFISVILDTIIKHHKGDGSKVFTTGISRGGEFSLYLADKLSSRITAIAPVCASVPREFVKNYTFSHPTPVLLINGTADPLIKYEGGFGKYLRTDEPGEGFDMTPTDILIRKITTLDSCDANPVQSDMPNSDENDDCHSVKYVYACRGINVTLIKVINGGHTWPGGKQYLPKFMIGKVARDFNAEDEIFNFFLSIIKQLPQSH
jgi:polyhydroxybutyrate depolymerase